jgi:MSHA biogenesis protein MshO
MMPTLKISLSNLPDARRQAGFNLVEMIVVIAITGILSAAVAVFIKGPISGFIDTTRRAELTDIADTALRRMGRDLHLALPNSVRVTSSGSSFFLEYLQAPAGGRYRESGPGDTLDFTTADTSFDYIGPTALNAAPYNVVTRWWVVIFNMSATDLSGSVPNAYLGNNSSQITAITATNITITPFQFLYESPGRRFQVVETPVTYECNNTTGRLTRYWNYNIQPNQPTPPPAGLPTFTALLVGSTNASVINCASAFTYTSGVTDRSGVVSIRLDVRNVASSEQASLYQEVHVNNVP